MSDKPDEEYRIVNGGQQYIYKIWRGSSTARIGLYLNWGGSWIMDQEFRKEHGGQWQVTVEEARDHYEEQINSNGFKLWED